MDAVVYYRVSNATVSIANVENAHHSTRLLAQTTLRNTMGTRHLHEILSERMTISGTMQVSFSIYFFLLRRTHYYRSNKSLTRIEKMQTDSIGRGYRSVGHQSGTCRNVSAFFFNRFRKIYLRFIIIATDDAARTFDCRYNCSVQWPPKPRQPVRHGPKWLRPRANKKQRGLCARRPRSSATHRPLYNCDTFRYIIELIRWIKWIFKCFFLFSFPAHAQTLNTISAEKNSTIVFPLPIDILSYFMKSKEAVGNM